MANQSIGTPRFFIDFTQLAKLKGQFYWEEGVDSSGYLLDNSAESTNNIWNFDFYKVQTYEANSSATDHGATFHFRFNEDKNFSRLIRQSNWAGFFNHNFASTLGGSPFLKIAFKDLDDNQIVRNLTDDADFFSNISLDKNGYSLATFEEVGGEDLRLLWMGIRQQDMDLAEPFSVACASFGRYYDMPNSPDLSITKSIQYEGVKVQRTLGGSDYVQINNSGTPNWISGEPFALVHPDESSSRFGRHGRRNWKLKFSYISNDDLFFDLNRPNVFGDLNSAEGSDSNEISAGSEIQQIFDLTLGGALSFIFCPDKDATNPEFAQCRLDQESLHATQVAHQTWDVSMNIVEIW